MKERIIRKIFLSDLVKFLVECINIFTYIYLNIFNKMYKYLYIHISQYLNYMMHIKRFTSTLINLINIY